MLIIGTLDLVVCVPCYIALVRSSADSYPTVLVLTVVVMTLLCLQFALATCYITERFRSQSRASGFGIGYSLSIIPGAFFAFYQDWLGAVMPFEYTGTVLVVVSAVLIIVGAWWGPETKDVDF